MRSFLFPFRWLTVVAAALAWLLYRVLVFGWFSGLIPLIIIAVLIWRLP